PAPRPPYPTRRSSDLFKSLSSAHFNDYAVGLNLSVPLGFRFEHASVRTARLQLAQAYYVLKDQEDRARRVLVQQYQDAAGAVLLDRKSTRLNSSHVNI